jgi:hypothetical protein
LGEILNRRIKVVEKPCGKEEKINVKNKQWSNTDNQKN